MAKKKNKNRRTRSMLKGERKRLAEITKGKNIEASDLALCQASTSSCLRGQNASYLF